MQSSSTLDRIILFAFAVWASLASAAIAGTIRDIEISGAQRVTPPSVLSTMSLKAGERYDAAKANQSIHALFATGQYKDVRISEKDGRIAVVLVENPSVEAVTFSGNSAVKSERLTEAIKLKRGGVFSDARASADVLVLREIYRSEGRLATTIAVQTTPKPNNAVGVVFAISEGEVNRVSSITFEGNTAFTASELEGVIATARSGWLDILKSDSIYVAARLDEDRDRLRRHYLTHGFADAKILNAQGTRDADGKGYSVRFVIEEGERYAFGNVALDVALADAERDKLLQLVKMRPGDVYDADAVEKTNEAIILALWDSGVKFARVKPDYKRDRGAGRIDVTFRIDESPHVVVKRVDVKGNAKTNASVILREMRVREGDAFSSTALERDRLRIKALGIFKSVTVSTAKGSGAEDVVVAVEVVEDETLELSVGGGYSSSEGVIGDVAVEETNLFGTGRRAKLKLAGSLYKLQAEASFLEPHLLGTNLTGGVDAFYRDYDASRFSSYKSRKIGGGVHLDYDLTETVSGSVNYKFTQNRIYDVGANASPAIRDAVPGFPTATENTYYTSSVGYALAYDTRNSKKLPTSGSSFVLTQDFAGPGGDVRYVRSTIDARTYFSPTKDLTLVGRATARNIFGWGGQDVRLLDVYYMGGDQVRGFATAGIGPRDTASSNQDALGGTNFISTTAEARFNLPLVPEGIGLRGAVFADAGSLFGTSANASRLPGLAGSAAALRSSVGVGLIWDSPIGALRADYTIPLTKEPFDKTQPWSFGLAAF